MESETQRQNGRRDGKDFVLALVVVILSVSVAVSGWIIISALDKLDSDPFEEERQYDVTGTMVLDGTDIPCSGSIASHYSSESEAYRVFTYHVSYGDGSTVRETRFSLMFDSEKNPVEDMYVHQGSEDGYEVWSGSDHGVDSTYYLNKDNIVERIVFDVSGDHLEATIRK